MKVGIYDSYLDTMGGGERYSLTLAEWLSQEHEVEVIWPDESLKRELASRLNLDLKRVKFEPKYFTLFTKRGNLLRRWRISRNYDVIFYVSDGSVPFLFAKKNILHFQVPFKFERQQTLLNKIKLRNVTVVCNSYFTKKFIDKTYGVDSLVVYPPVDTKAFKPAKKQNMILSVGRFVDFLHAKRQDILIEVFKKMVDEGLAGWQLNLVGGAIDEEGEYLKKLKKLISGYPIKLIVNATFSQLQTLYGETEIFWHAAGFGVKEEIYPERMEHFGITTIEAMSGSAVPIVFRGGGLPEVVSSEKTGFLWQTKEELQKVTWKLIRDEGLRRGLAERALKQAKKFSKSKFIKTMEKVIL
jgi:glycosyltransferase involved in cell wall biosynthesis